jgi:uncharacterized protein (TIGR03086 family)
MTRPEVFIASNEALGKVIAQITDNQLAKTVPAGMSWRPEPQTLREIVNYHAYDDAWVGDVLSGKTIEEVGNTYDGDLLGDDPLGNYAKYNHAACDAVEGYTDLDRIVHLSYGDFSAADYLMHITVYRGMRTYDLARFIGVELNVSAELVQALWDLIEPVAEDLRAMHVFAPRVEVPAEAPLEDRLLGLTGRQP